MRRIPIICVVVVACLASRAAGQEGVRLADLPWYEAETYIEHWVAPEYPGIVRAVQVEGAVTVYARVSPDGTVEGVFAIGGIPLLDQVAIEAVRQWRFRPITTGGQPTPARLQLLVRFYPTESPKAQPAVIALLERARECRNLLDRNQHVEAEAPCLSLGDLVRKVPSGRYNERLLAYTLLGEMLSAHGQSAKAVEAFRTAVKPLNPDWGNEDVAVAYAAAARAYLATGDVKNATLCFEGAERGLAMLYRSVRGQQATSRAEGQMQSEMADRSARLLRGVHGELIACLRQAGRADDARKAEERLNRLIAGAGGK